MTVRLRSFDGRETGHRRILTIPLTTATSQTQRCFHIADLDTPFRIHGAKGWTRTLAGSVTADAYLVGDNEIIKAGALGIDSVAEKFLIAAGRYIINGKVVEKAAATAIVFTAAHPVTASKSGAILVQMDDAGTVSTLISGATQTTTQAYDDAASAVAMLPAASTNKLAIGYITINNNTGTWTANTDDMTDASDVTTATFTTTAVTVSSAFAEAITFAAGKTISVAPDDLAANFRDNTGAQRIYFEYTSDGSGALTDGTVQLIWRPVTMYADAS